MGERTQYTPGSFSWTDLTTTDQDGAKAFYTELYGWKAFDAPIGEDGVYSMMSIDGKQVAAISGQMPAQVAAGAPPAWNSYVTVASADETARRAAELGATVHVPPFDVVTAGRMAVIEDPHGAVFMIWEPKDHPGAGLVNAHGALAWNELATPDMDASARFYGDLFGWETEPMDGGSTPYLVIKTAAGATNGGIRPAMPPGSPPYWVVYFGTDDIDGSLATVERLGGTKLSDVIDIGPGRFAAVQDPQGAVFALYAGEFDD